MPVNTPLKQNPDSTMMTPGVDPEVAPVFWTATVPVPAVVVAPDPEMT